MLGSLLYLSHLILKNNMVNGSMFSDGSSSRCHFNFTSDGKGKMKGIPHTSPNYPQPYPGEYSCTYTFIAQKGERVQLWFKAFDLYLPPGVKITENNTCKQDYDHFTAYVELEGRMSEIRTFCGNTLPHQLMSADSTLHAEFTAHHHPGHTNQGFKFYYRFVTDFGVVGGVRDYAHPDEGECSFNYNGSDKGTPMNGSFSSPNYPGFYPRNTVCHYKFYAGPEQIVRIFFTYFDVEGYNQCDDQSQSDYILFSNYQSQDRKNRRYCGRRRPGNQESEKPFFQMVFHSNSIFDATGFYALYQFAKEPKPAITKIKITGSAAGNNFWKSIELIPIQFLILLLWTFRSS